MDNRSSDSSLEFVLDNRGLIVTFALLILICGVFFVLGFVEGKRQGAAAAKISAEVKLPDQERSTNEIPAPKTAVNPGSQTSKEQLDWYSNVNKRGKESARLEPPLTAVKPGHSQPDTRKAAPNASSRATYTVQVGAFRKREDAEKRAEMLKAKGYECVIEAPVEPTQPLYLLKVGKCSSRAEAVAISVRLQKDGFSTFIKTN